MNMKENKFTISGRLKSFGYAFNGLKILFKEEFNARIHFIISILVIILGFILKLELHEWIYISLCIGFVFVLEIINSSIENLCDLISIEQNEKIKRIKDLSAAAVLIGAITAATVGLIIFIPKIISLL